MQSEVRKIIGYDAELCIIDDKGRDYLKIADNPGSMLAINGILVVSSDNKTLNQDTRDAIEDIVKTSILIYAKVKENVETKS